MKPREFSDPFQKKHEKALETCFRKQQEHLETCCNQLFHFLECKPENIILMVLGRT